ncbi:MAG: hypothetical protein QXL34_07180 [Thermosphaera sp.]
MRTTINRVKPRKEIVCRSNSEVLRARTSSAGYRRLNVGIKPFGEVVESVMGKTTRVRKIQRHI